jgi:hypothetical protein
MALGHNFVVHLDKQPHASFVETMGDVRSWLDRCKIEPVSFKPVTSVKNGVGFDIGFKSEDEALLFRRAFGLHSSTDG